MAADAGSVPSGSLPTPTGEEEEETVADTSRALLKIRYDLSKACVCCLCSSRSTSKSPLVSSSEFDRYQGKRPWAKYRKVSTNEQEEEEAVAYRVPEGKLCLLCQNVYHLLGLKHRYGSYKQYHEKVIKQRGGDHKQFMSSLAKWVEEHNENPERQRVSDGKTIAKAKVQIMSQKSSGVRVQQDREFVTQEDWNEELDGVWDEAAATELVVAGKTYRGCYKKPKRPGCFIVSEYSDARSKESRLEQDSETPFATEALEHAREAASASLQEARVAREAATVEGPAGVDMADLLAMIKGAAPLAERVPGPDSATGAPATTSDAVAHEESSESAEEDGGMSSASRLAAQFGAPKAKASQAKAQAKAQGKALATGSKTAKSTQAVKKDPTSHSGSTGAAGRAKQGPTQAQPAQSSLTQLPQFTTVKKEKPDKQGASQGPVADATLVLDGRGQRLQESLLQHAQDVERDLQSFTIALVEDAKERKKQQKLLNTAQSTLKSQTKRLQDSANKTALEQESQLLSELSAIASAAQTAFAAINSSNPDAECLQQACRHLRGCRLHVHIDPLVAAKMVSLAANRSCLYRQYGEACRFFCPSADPEGQEIAEVSKRWSRKQVEEWVLTDMSTRILVLIRSIPMAEVSKTQSDSKEQVRALCDAIANADAEGLLSRVQAQAVVARALVVPHEDLAACRVALDQTEAFSKLAEGAPCEDGAMEDVRPLLQFFVEHKLGNALTAAARDAVRGGEGDRAVQDALGRLKQQFEQDVQHVEDLDTSSMSGILLPHWKQIEEARKMAARPSHKVEVEHRAKAFLVWLAEKIRYELQEAVLGFLDYITEAHRSNGMVVPLSAKDPATELKALVDLKQVFHELHHVERTTSVLMEKLRAAQASPKDLEDRLKKDAYVRGQLQEFVSYVFEKLVPGLSPEPPRPSADVLAFWTSEFPVAVEELLPSTEESQTAQRQFFQILGGAAVTELQTLALQAYHQVGLLVEQCIDGRSNESVAAASVEKLSMEMPPDCPMKKVWQAFFRLAPKCHELRSPHASHDYGRHLEDYANLEKEMADHEQVLQANPEKAAALKFLDPKFLTWVDASRERARQLLRAALEERVEAARNAGVKCLEALQKMGSPHIDEGIYRAVMAQNVQTWASVAQASRLAGESLQNSCGQLTTHDSHLSGDAAFEKSATRVACRVTAAAKLLTAHVTFFAGLTLLRSPSSGAKSPEGRATSKKLDTMLHAFWNRTWIETPFSEKLPTAYVHQILKEMEAAVTRALGSCGVSITADGWECAEEKRGRLNGLRAVATELKELRGEVSTQAAAPAKPTLEAEVADRATPTATCHDMESAKCRAKGPKAEDEGEAQPATKQSVQNTEAVAEAAAQGTEKDGPARALVAADPASREAEGGLERVAGPLADGLEAQTAAPTAAQTLQAASRSSAGMGFPGSDEAAKAMVTEQESQNPSPSCKPPTANEVADQAEQAGNSECPEESPEEEGIDDDELVEPEVLEPAGGGQHEDAAAAASTQPPEPKTPAWSDVTEADRRLKNGQKQPAPHASDVSNASSAKRMKQDGACAQEKDFDKHHRCKTNDAVKDSKGDNKEKKNEKKEKKESTKEKKDKKKEKKDKKNKKDKKDKKHKKEKKKNKDKGQGGDTKKRARAASRDTGGKRETVPKSAAKAKAKAKAKGKATTKAKTKAQANDKAEPKALPKTRAAARASLQASLQVADRDSKETTRAGKKALSTLSFADSEMMTKGLADLFNN